MGGGGQSSGATEHSVQGTRTAIVGPRYSPPQLNCSRSLTHGPKARWRRQKHPQKHPQKHQPVPSNHNLPTHLCSPLSAPEPSWCCSHPRLTTKSLSRVCVCMCAPLVLRGFATILLSGLLSAATRKNYRVLPYFSSLPSKSHHNILIPR
jgi:hypothetical protein